MKNLDYIFELMPEGWQEAAKERKALLRSRNIKTAEELLSLIFLYQTSGESYGLTSALTQISEKFTRLNKTAVHKRIINSADWLKWLCLNICCQEGYIVEPPDWLNNYRVCLVDASDYAVNGSKNSDFRFHYLLELFTLNAVEMYFTSASEGETLTRYQNIKQGDLILGDRAYGTIKGIKHTLDCDADFLLRMKANSFNLYTSDGKKFDLTEQLKSWKVGKQLDLQLFCKSGKTIIPIRVCALAKTKEQIKESNRKTKKANKGRKEPTKLQSIWNKYIVLATSLPQEITAKQIFELYHMRWQIELVFKRFKSIFGGGKFSARKKKAVEAWFYGKLLIAILCEIMVKRGHFPPEAKI